jgi:hypothetical protein
MMLIDKALITAFRALPKRFFDGNRGVNYSVFRLKMNCTNAHGGLWRSPESCLFSLQAKETDAGSWPLVGAHAT